MPIKVQNDLPAKEILENENIFVMDEYRSMHQDIRPLQICILNLMPVKQDTELQLLRALSNTPLQINITFMKMNSHVSLNTSVTHLNKFYHTFDELKHQKFDGMIITGAPVEHLDYEKVNYWKELTEIMEWSKPHVTSTMHICWGAQAGLYYHYGIPKYPLEQKLFGVFPHVVERRSNMLFRGSDDVFMVPHSRHTIIYAKDILDVKNLKILAYSKRAGASVIKSTDNRQVFVTGHMEYDRFTLKNEYERDKAKGLDIKPPVNYFADKDMKEVKMNWSSTANLFYINWLNYYVYQVTPYDINQER